MARSVYRSAGQSTWSAQRSFYTLIACCLISKHRARGLGAGSLQAPGCALIPDARELQESVPRHLQGARAPWIWPRSVYLPVCARPLRMGIWRTLARRRGVCTDPGAAVLLQLRGQPSELCVFRCGQTKNRVCLADRLVHHHDLGLPRSAFANASALELHNQLFAALCGLSVHVPSIRSEPGIDAR